MTKLPEKADDRSPTEKIIRPFCFIILAPPSPLPPISRVYALNRYCCAAILRRQNAVCSARGTGSRCPQKGSPLDWPVRSDLADGSCRSWVAQADSLRY